MSKPIVGSWNGKRLCQLLPPLVSKLAVSLIAQNIQELPQSPQH
uniref:Uncharacterized protein n=1 Tax=Manihot esculenta TaxID=3983 RepID=A0A2C9VAG9_MANES